MPDKSRPVLTLKSPGPWTHPHPETTTLSTLTLRPDTGPSTVPRPGDQALAPEHKSQAIPPSIDLGHTLESQAPLTTRSWTGGHPSPNSVKIRPPHQLQITDYPPQNHSFTHPTTFPPQNTPFHTSCQGGNSPLTLTHPPRVHPHRPRQGPPPMYAFPILTRAFGRK